VFLADHILDAEAEIAKTIYLLSAFPAVSLGKRHTFSNLLQTNIQHSIIKGPAHEKFERKI
jgi:hypothetical protein